LFLSAPAKLNLCLYLGPHRDDGLHEICSLFEPLSLEDRIEVSGATADEVLCPGIEPEDLAARALAALRDRGWNGPPVRVEISKRIPVAAGLGGGSADAAAVLRLGAGEVDAIEEAALALGADVPAQLRSVFSLVGGAGERVEPLPPAGEHALVLLPDSEGLSTAEVYAQADRMGLGRDAAELEAVAKRLRDAAGNGATPLAFADLLVNDLQPAALALRPRIAMALESLLDAGATQALISGSGPTAFGLFPDLAAAEAASRELDSRAITCEPGGA
jgi:4-diphosphocytidyl-2-C-methyl-D-erythritol kinase